jgi:hypothetical protein
MIMSPDKDNLVVEVWFAIEKDAEGYPKSRDSEGLLCKPLDAECSKCTVASVPFYLRNIAYGDIISTQDNGTGSVEFKEVVKRGGYSIYRILLHESAKKDELMDKLFDFGTVLEHEGDLIAVAVPPTVKSDLVVDYILEGKGKGFWGAQDGYIFEETDAPSGQ